MNAAAMGVPTERCRRVLGAGARGDTATKQSKGDENPTATLGRKPAESSRTEPAPVGRLSLPGRSAGAPGRNAVVQRLRRVKIAFAE